MNRRKLIGGIGLLVAAPAIVKISNIMPVKAWDVNPCAEFGFDIRVLSQPVVFTSHHYMRLNRDGVGVIDIPPGVIELKPGDRVEMVVHDDRCRPVFRSNMVARDFRPTVIQKGMFGWREL